LKIAPDIDVRPPKIKTGPALWGIRRQYAAAALRSMLIQILP